MNTALKELMGVVGIFSVPFKKEMMEMSPYINKDDPFTMFKTNSSKTARDSFNSGKMNDFKYYGIRLKKNFRKKYGYDCTKIEQYVESRDSEQKYSGEMKITTIYKVSNKKKKKLYYVSCKTVIHFPVLVIEMGDKKRKIIPLKPYIWEVYLCTFGDKKMLMEYSPEITDRIYFMLTEERYDLVYSNADDTISKLELSDEEKKGNTYIHSVCMRPYCFYQGAE